MSAKANAQVEKYVPPIYAKDVVRKQMTKLATDLITKQVSDKTVKGYYNQIAHNLTIGKKAEFLVRRDLAEAKENLKKEGDFRELGDLLMGLNEEMSLPTINKWVTIGKDEYCLKLFNAGRLPIGWTTQYELAKLTASQKKVVDKFVNIETTTKDIKEAIDPEGDKDKMGSYPEYTINQPNTIFQVAYSTRGANANKLIKLQKKLQEVVDEMNKETVDYISDSSGEKVTTFELRTRNNPHSIGGVTDGRSDSDYIETVYMKNISFFKSYDADKIKKHNSQTAYEAKVLAKYKVFENLKDDVVINVGGDLPSDVNKDQELYVKERETLLKRYK